MMVRAGTGWQYILADLSLILFMVTAAALAQAEDPQAGRRARAVQTGDTRPLSPQGQPLALYRAAPGAPPLGQWLRDQAADARQQLTIVAQYRPGEQAAAMAQAEALAHEAGEAGAHARIVVEPGSNGTTAALAFDMPDAAMARSLLQNGRNHGLQEVRP
jgi:hypothetical protein